MKLYDFEIEIGIISRTDRNSQKLKNIWEENKILKKEVLVHSFG